MGSCNIKPILENRFSNIDPKLKNRFSKDFSIFGPKNLPGTFSKIEYICKILQKIFISPSNYRGFCEKILSISQRFFNIKIILRDVYVAYFDVFLSKK